VRGCGLRGCGDAWRRRCSGAGLRRCGGAGCGDEGVRGGGAPNVDTTIRQMFTGTVW